MTEVTLVSFTEYCSISNLFGLLVATAVFTVIICAGIILQMLIKMVILILMLILDGTPEWNTGMKNAAFF